MQLEKSIGLFNEEFASIKDKFIIHNLAVIEARNSHNENFCKPGVYVFWKEKRGVIKVGRHLVNSCKRALEHIRDNTGGSMKLLENDPNARLILFNVKEKKDLHWVMALEVFFELNLKPEIRSGRLG